MRAVVVTEFGDPDRLQFSEVADPQPSAGECLVRLGATDVLFLDTMLRSGNAPQGMAPQLPWIPGNGAAGRVLALGDDVAGDWIGRSVGVHTGNRGAYAELVAVPESDLVPLPDGLDERIAAALLHDGPTALKLMQLTGVSSEDTVLVLGASGGLGIALVQLASAHARRVVAVARDAAKRERIAALGVDAVIDPETPDWKRRCAEALGSSGATVILDNVGPSLGADALPLLAEGGRFSAHATHGDTFTQFDPAEIRARRATVTGIEEVQLDPDEMAELTDRSFKAAAAGDLRPIIGQTFPLRRADDAHRMIESRGAFGKTLLTTD